MNCSGFEPRASINTICITELNAEYILLNARCEVCLLIITRMSATIVHLTLLLFPKFPLLVFLKLRLLLFKIPFLPKFPDSIAANIFSDITAADI